MKLTRKQLLRDLYISFYEARRHKAKMSYVVSFEKNLKDNLENLCDDLYNRTYQPLPSKCFIVDYPKKREVFAAQFRDRVVHHLYYMYTNKVFERTFIQDTYSCIKKRGTHYGVNRIVQHIRQESDNWNKECYVMKIDIRVYFMHIDRRKLLEISLQSLRSMSKHRISKRSETKWEDVLDFDFIYYLTELIVMIDPKVSCTKSGDESLWVGLDKNKSLFHTPDGCGLPIGNLTSQLFSNVYLNVFDQYVKRVLKCKHYGRYVDDSCIISCDKDWLISLVPKIRHFLNTELCLDMHMGKLTITKVSNGVEFLGIYIKPYRNYLSRRTVYRMTEKLKELRNEPRTKVLRSINSYLGIMQHTSSYKLSVRLFKKKEYLCIGVVSCDMKKIEDKRTYFN